MDNHNKTTFTDTLLLEFPSHRLYTNLYIQNMAKVAVPLRWGRVQVCEQVRWILNSFFGPIEIYVLSYTGSRIDKFVKWWNLELRASSLCFFGI